MWTGVPTTFFVIVARVKKKKEKKGNQQWCVEDTFGIAYFVESLVFSSIAQKKKTL